MRVRVGSAEVEADTHVEGDEVLVTVEGQTTRVPFRRLPGGRLLLRVGDRWVTAWSDGQATWIDGQSTEVRRVARAAGPEARGSLSSPMPSTVLRVLVAPGEVVTAGQACVVVSAMKTEVTLRAPREGVVAEVRVAPGQTVKAGEATVVLAETGGGT